MNYSDTTNMTGMQEFVGTALLDTIGLVINSPDTELKARMGLNADVKSLALISSRTGAAGQVIACDDACKETGAIPVSVELPRDTKGWGGHGCYIVMAADDPENARETVRLALENINRNASEVHISDAGHLEFAFTASSGSVVEMAFGAKRGKAFGFMAASPAAIGLVIADRALKRSPVELISYMTPSVGTSHSNEVIISFSGETSAVFSAVSEGKQNGMKLLRAMGSEPASPGSNPFI